MIEFVNPSTGQRFCLDTEWTCGEFWVLHNEPCPAWWAIVARHIRRASFAVDDLPNGLTPEQASWIVGDIGRMATAMLRKVGELPALPKDKPLAQPVPMPLHSTPRPVRDPVRLLAQARAFGRR